MTTPSASVEIYCLKCKAKTGSTDVQAVTLKNGRPATRATCVDCGTKKSRISVLSRSATYPPRPATHPERSVVGLD